MRRSLAARAENKAMHNSRLAARAVAQVREDSTLRARAVDGGRSCARRAEFWAGACSWCS